MTPVPSETATLFATEHGSVEWTSHGQLQLTLGATDWILSPSQVTSLRNTTRSLAGEVYHCEWDCRWQVRVDGHATVVLDSDEVLRLDALLDGAVTMLELSSILEDAGIGQPVVGGER